MLASALAATSANSTSRLHCSDVAEPAAIQVVEPASTTLTVVAPTRSWLELDEDGRTLNVAGASSALTIASPPRLARFGIWIEPGITVLKISAAMNGQAPLRFGARLFCRTATARYQSLSGLGDAAALLTRGHWSATELTAAVAVLEHLEASQTAPDISAYAAHLSAQLQGLAGQGAKAAAAFARAQMLWNAAADRARALAARAALAEQAETSGDFDAALRATQAVPPAADDAIGYYAARLLDSRCTVLAYQGLHAQATRCFARLERRLQTLREPAALATALLEQGELQRDLGRIGAAHAAVSRAERLIARESRRLSGADIAIARGRLRLLRADLALQRGSVAAAIGDYHAALADFDTAGARRWRASTFIQMAGLFCPHRRVCRCLPPAAGRRRAFRSRHNAGARRPFAADAGADSTQ